MGNTTQTVDAIGKMHFEGNIIPASWYQHIRTKENKPDFVAISILSDVVYWYRPTEIRDERTGQVVEYKKKFAADKLQRSYDQLAEQFSISKEQARDACHRLRDGGLLSIEIRHGIRGVGGTICNNVVYLEPVPQTLLGISYRPTQMGVAKQPSPPSNVDTNTEISAQTSSEIKNNTAQAPASEIPSAQEIWNEMPSASNAEIADNGLIPVLPEEKHLFEALNHERAARHYSPLVRFKTTKQREKFRECIAVFNGSTDIQVDSIIANGKSDLEGVVNALDWRRRNPSPPKPPPDPQRGIVTDEQRAAMLKEHYRLKALNQRANAP